MNNKKFAYCTVITNDDYTPCIIRQKQRMDYLKCKYPFIVLVTDNVEDKVINKLKENNIEYRIVPLLSFSYNNKNFRKRLAQTVNKFYSFILTEYEKVLFIEADTIIIKNIDFLFDKYDMKNKQLLTFTRHENELWSFGGFFFVKPSNKFFINILNMLIKDKFNYDDDEHFLNKYFFQNILLEIPPYKDNLIHLSGIKKLWNLNISYLNKLFNKISQDNFNRFLDDFNSLYLLEQLTRRNIEFFSILHELESNYKL